MANPHQHTRDGHGRYTRSPETAARDAQAAELRAQGSTYQQIADELGYSHKRDAQKAVQRAIREIIHGPAEQLLTLYMDRLEDLFTKAMEIADEEYVVVSHGKVVTMRDPETGEEKPVKDNAPKLAAFREARAALADVRKMTGLDQPTQVQVSGGVRYEVVGVNPDDLK